MSIEEIEASFTGERLLRAVCDQALVEGDRDLAFALIDAGKKSALSAGSVLYEKGDSTKGIFLILHGLIEVSVDEQPLAELPAREAVGSWPVLYSDPEYKVTARALEDTVLLCVGPTQFRAVARRFPMLWQNLARAQVDRLRRMNEYFLPKNSVPQLLIGSTSENLSVARKLGELLEASGGVDVKVWTEVFPAGESTLESLTSGLDDWDFALFFLTPDDDVTSRGTQTPAPRDNTIFEAGLCIGRLGRMRTLLLQASEPGDLKVPTDLKGITRLFYDEEPDEVLNKVLTRVRELGPRTRLAIDDLP